MLEKTVSLIPNLKPFGTEKARIKIAYGGRGSGKSWTFARLLLLMGYERPIRVLCTREIQKTIKESVHMLLVDQVNQLGLQRFYASTEKGLKSIPFEDGRCTEFIFAGLRSDDIHKLKSLEGVDYCWVEEAHVVSAKSLDVLNPTIRKEGSEIWFSYNPELEDDEVHQRYVVNRYPDSIVVKVNYSDNPWFPAVLEEERQHLYRTDKSEGRMKYANIWEGQCLPAVEGAIFANEVARLHEDGRIRPLTYDPKGKVHVVMDLGYGVMTAILVQKFASTVQIIGYKELRHSTYHDLTLELQQHKWNWGKVFMPHDAAHRDPKYGKSHFEVMEELGWKTEQIPQIGVENYIEAGRLLFDNLYISDNEECNQFLRCVKRWRYNVTETSTSSQKTMAPMKDEFSHGAEAYCYTAVVAEQLVNDDAVVADPYRGFTSGYAA